MPRLDTQTDIEQAKPHRTRYLPLSNFHCSIHSVQGVAVSDRTYASTYVRDIPYLVFTCINTKICSITNCHTLYVCTPYNPCVLLCVPRSFCATVWKESTATAPSRNFASPTPNTSMLLLYFRASCCSSRFSPNLNTRATHPGVWIKTPSSIITPHKGYNQSRTRR